MAVVALSTLLLQCHGSQSRARCRSRTTTPRVRAAARSKLSTARAMARIVGSRFRNTFQNTL
eukprot:11686508-Alexandrium_andersonii.AAC.1